MSKHSGAGPDAMDLGSVKINVSDYVSQGNAILGIRDSGKSYTATKIAEELLCRDIPFTAFDPIGVWRFLRHGRRQWELIVAGGEGADVPLTVESAPLILRHAMEKKLPLVFDLYDMTMSKADWRRIVQECIHILLYENKRHGLRHVFIEEAAEFVPQLVTNEYGKVYAEIEKLARMGGNAMLGYTLINQRAEQLNKAVLELCDTLFLHRQKGRLSLTALSKWLEFGDKKKAGAIIESLPMLEQGHCWIWQGGTDVPVRTTIPKKQSYHPNRRQVTDPGPAVPVPHMLAGLSLDPSPRYQVPQPASHVAAAPIAAPEPVQVPVFEQGDLVRLETLYQQFDAKAREIETISGNILATARSLNESLKRAEALRVPRHVPPPQTRAAGRPTVLAKGPQRILQVLKSRHPLRLTQSQLGTISGFTPSTMRTYLPGLREAGLIDTTADDMGLTAAGLASVGEPTEPMPKGGRALLDFWKPKLSQGEAAIMECLFNFRGRPMEMSALEHHTSYTNSTLRTYLPNLRRNNLIDATELKISPEFVE